jgi:hypothetical protein
VRAVWCAWRRGRPVLRGLRRSVGSLPWVTPYHLAHGLLDHARYLLAHADADADADADAEAEALALDEARDIGHRLRCSPLLDRAEDPARAQL